MSNRESIMRRVITVLTVIGVLTGLFVLGAGCGGAGGGGGGDLPDLPETPGSVGGGVQEGTFTVTALDRYSGSPVIGANVYVAIGSSAFHLPTTSTGTAVFPGLSPGPVTVTIIAASYIPITIVDIDAAAVTIPLDADSYSSASHTITLNGLTTPVIDGRGAIVWSNPRAGLAFSVMDGGSGNPVTYPDPVVIDLVDNWPVAIVSYVFDASEDPDNILQAYMEYTSGPPSGGIELNLTSGSMKQVSGSVTVPGSFDLTIPGVDINIIPSAHLKALGDIFVGDVVDPFITSSTNAVFGTPYANDMRVARIPRDGEYAYVAYLADRSITDEDRVTIHAVRGSYDSLGTTVNFDDFRATATSLSVTTGTLTPTISWTNTKAPGFSGGYFLVVLANNDAGTLDWAFMADGATTSVTLPAYTGNALADSTDYKAFVNALYIPSFDFDNFTYEEFEGGFTHQTSKEYSFTTP